MLLVAVAPIHAQDSLPRFEAIVGGPATAAFAVPAGGRFTLRPDLTYQRGWAAVGPVRRGSSTTGLGLSLLYTLTRDAQTHTYVGPRVALSRFSSGRDGNTVAIYDLFAGAQAQVTPRIGVLGEAGLRVSDADTSTPDLYVRSVSLAVRTSLGVAIRF